jgi:hypothetical protein
MTASYTRTGGAKLGRFNASWPFATLSATSDALRLSCLGRNYDFSRGSIRGLSRHRGILSTGLRIDHNNASYPDLIVFWASLFPWTSGFRKVKTHLEGLGYEIRDRDG